MNTTLEYSDAEEPIVINTDNIASIKPIDAFICVFVRYGKQSTQHKEIVNGLNAKYNERQLHTDDADVMRYILYKNEKGVFADIVKQAEEFIKYLTYDRRERYDTTSIIS